MKTVGLNSAIKFIAPIVLFMGILGGIEASSVDVVARASKPTVARNEAVDIYIHVTNKSDRPISLPEAKLVDGFLIPHRYQQYIETYIVDKNKLRLVSGVSGSVKNTRHSSKKRLLAKGDTVCYKIKCVPFSKDDGTELSVVSLHFLGFKAIDKQKIILYKDASK